MKSASSKAGRAARPTPQTLPAPDWWPQACEALLASQGYTGPDYPVPARTPEPLDGLVRLILAQQNTWAVAQRQWEALRLAYPRWETLLVAEPDEVEAVLRGAGGGLARSKARTICAAVQRLAEWGGEGERVPSLRFLSRLDDAGARAALESLPGVGPRTASLLLLFHLGRPAAAVDTNIERVLHRLEVVPPTWPAAKQEPWLEQVLPREAGFRAAFHRAGVRHGRQVCTRSQPRCAECPLRPWCPSARFFLGDADLSVVRTVS